MIDKFIIYASYTSLLIFFALIYYIEAAGRYILCFGHNPILSESTCEIIRSGLFLLSIFITLLVWVFSSVYLYFKNKIKLRVCYLKFVKHVSIFLIPLNAFGFVELEFCLGFLGCSSFYLWPIFIPFTVVFLVLSQLYFELIFLKYSKRDNWERFDSFIVTIVFTLLTPLLLFGSVKAIDLISDIKLHKYLNTVESLKDPTILIPRIGEDEFSLSRNSYKSSRLTASHELVEILVIDNKNNLQAPRFLNQVTAKGHTDKWLSNKQNYYVEKGIINAGFDRPPFRYQILGKKLGITDIKFISETDTVLSKIESLLIFPETKIDIEISIDDTSKIHLNKLQYDWNGDGLLDSEISWIEERDYIRDITNILHILVSQSEIDPVQELALRKILSDIPTKSTSTQVEQLNEILFLLQGLESDLKLHQVKSIISELLINLQYQPNTQP